MLKAIRAWFGSGTAEDAQPQGIHGFDIPAQTSDSAAPSREDVLGTRYCEATDKVDTSVRELQAYPDSGSTGACAGDTLVCVPGAEPVRVRDLQPGDTVLTDSGPADLSGMAWVRGTVVQLTEAEQKQLFNSTRMRRNRTTRDMAEAAEYARGVVAEVMRRREAVDGTWDTTPELTPAQQLEFDVVYAQAKLAGLDADACRHRAYFAAYRLGDVKAVAAAVDQLRAA